MIVTLFDTETKPEDEKVNWDVELLSFNIEKEVKAIQFVKRYEYTNIVESLASNINAVLVHKCSNALCMNSIGSPVIVIRGQKMKVDTVAVKRRALYYDPVTNERCPVGTYTPWYIQGYATTTTQQEVLNNRYQATLSEFLELPDVFTLIHQYTIQKYVEALKLHIQKHIVETETLLDYLEERVEDYNEEGI